MKLPEYIPPPMVFSKKTAASWACASDNAQRRK